MATRPRNVVAKIGLVAIALMLGILGTFSIKTVHVSADDTVAFSDGIHTVGVDVMPGTYVAEFDEGICFVAVTDLDDATRNPSFSGRAIISITESDRQIETVGCGEWLLLNDGERGVSATDFGNGMFRVGIDVAPGIYTADGNDGRCLWFTVDDFAHRANPEQLLTWWKVGKPIVELKREDVGFYSIRCGTWHRRETDQHREPASEFPDGSYLVNIDISPGIYASDSGDAICNWFRTAPFGGIVPDNTGGYVSKGRQIIEILPSDSGFFSEGCGDWQLFSPSEESSSRSTMFDKGTFSVGNDIAPAVFVADSQDGRNCRWYLLSGFAGRASDISGFGTGALRGIAEIHDDAVGFRSVDCGEWQRVDDLSVDETLSDSIGDGEHIVGVHVKPGVYSAPGPESGRCSWRRVLGFNGADAQNVAVRNPVGRNIAEIMETDSVFITFGCGGWQPMNADYEREPFSSFGHGTWTVNQEVVAGTYTAHVPDGLTCFWSRLADFSGEPRAFTVSESTVRHSVATIRTHDAGFYSDGCGEWFAVTDELVDNDEATTSEFDDGIYIVRRDVAPGTYIATGIEGEICYWSRLAGFDGDSFNRISVYGSYGAAIATILDTDAGFRSFGCGSWQPISKVDDDAQTVNKEPATRFSDGTYRVGIDIAAGTYIASNVGQARCRWRRLADFTWSGNVIVERIASGLKIVEIGEDDDGFASSGCGEWNRVDLTALEPLEAIPTRFSNGSYVVGVHVEPGTYYAIPRRNGGCRWSRANGFGGTDPDAIASGKSNNRWIVTIDESDIGFVTHGCGTWRNIESALQLGPSETIEDGTYRVHEDILPGKYVARVTTQPFVGGKPTSQCTWKRTSGFGQTAEDTIEQGTGTGKITVTITQTDTGFTSTNCGTWQPTK